MSSQPFVHLHNHSQYSLLDGACRIEDMVKQAKQFAMPALAITDHGNLFGAVDFYKTAVDAGIKPIIGSEVYVAPGDRKNKSSSKNTSEASGYHLVLLAKDRQGYKNLMRLSSIGYLEGFYYKPRVDKAALREHAAGLMALSGCLKGEVPRYINNGQFKKARQAALEYRDIFGEGNYYLELQNHAIPEEDRVRKELLRMAQELHLPLVATNDSHYLYQEDYTAHDVLLCIGTGKELNDPNRLKMSTDQIYFKSPAEMWALFKDLPEALENTIRIAEACNFEMELGKIRLPAFPIPAGFESTDDYLEHLAYEGLRVRCGELTQAMAERLRYELGIIKEMGYSGYFLIVSDFVRYAREQNIPVNARGSAVGSLVAYVLGIINLNPLDYDLLFERFLNPERVSMPDIDIDIADRDRDKLIEYVINKYGKDKVSKIITFGTMAARAVVRDVGRVLGLSYGEVDKIAKLIPAEVGMNLNKAMERSPHLSQLEKTDPTARTLISYARTLEGLTRHASTHAAGVVISAEPLMDVVPLYKSNKDEITTQYSMDCVKEVGLVKMDFLGLRNLTVLNDAVRMLREQGHDIKLNEIPLDDAATFDLMSRGETTGVFQFESAGMREYLRRLQPSTINDMIAMNALYRPGPLGGGMVDDFIDRKYGRKKIEYLHPKLEPILKETYGVIVYQEQATRIASVLAGFSLGKADVLRDAMAKKKQEKMAKLEKEFLAGAEKQGVDRDIAKRIIDLIAYFAGYAFNKSHSVGYALIAYQTAYLKVHYPKEFMAANLTSEMGDIARVVILTDECRRMGIPVLPPDINESFADFRVTGQGIRFGMAAIKNVGRNAIDAIVKVRQESGPFKSLQDFCERVDLHSVNKRMIESLIQAGAMDCLGGHRAQLMAAIEATMEAAQAVQSARQKGQISLFDMPGLDDPVLAGERPLPGIAEWGRNELLMKEKEILGFYISGHPLAEFEDDLKLFTTTGLADLNAHQENGEVIVGGLVTEVKTITTRKGNVMGFVTLEDFTGSAEVVVFADEYGTYRELLQDDAMLLIKGTISSKDAVNKVKAASITPLAQVREKMTRTLYLVLSSAELDESKVAEIKTLLTAYPGPCEVRLCFQPEVGEPLMIRAGNVQVSPAQELLEALQRLIGAGRVILGTLQGPIKVTGGAQQVTAVASAGGAEDLEDEQMVAYAKDGRE